MFRTGCPGFKCPAKNFRFRRVVFSRVYTVMALYFQLLDWKGIWGVLYYVVMPAWNIERADW